MNYICPVCNYAELPDPPSDFTICPCCGAEFGYDDATRTYAQLLTVWLDSGAQWFSEFTRPPVGFCSR